MSQPAGLVARDDRGVHPVGGFVGELHAGVGEPDRGEPVEVFALERAPAMQPT